MQKENKNRLSYFLRKMKSHYRFFKGPLLKKDKKWSVYIASRIAITWKISIFKDVAIPGGKIPKVGTLGIPRKIY